MTEQLLAQQLESPSGTGRVDPDSPQPAPHPVIETGCSQLTAAFSLGTMRRVAATRASVGAGVPRPDSSVRRRRGIWVALFGAGAIAAVVAGLWFAGVAGSSTPPTRYQLWVAGDQEHSATYDVGDEYVHLFDGQGRISEMYAVNGRLLIPASDLAEFGAGQEGWVSIPMTDIDPVADLASPGRVADALTVPVKQCIPPSGDTQVLVRLALGFSFPDATAWICQEAMGAAARPGENVLVDRRPVEGSLEGPPPDASVRDVDAYPNAVELISAVSSELKVG